MEKREPKRPDKKQTQKTLPTPQPSQEVHHRVRVVNTIQVSPSPQIGYEVSFNPLSRGDLILKHNLFLARQRVQNGHKSAVIHNFLRFLPTTDPCQAKRVKRTESGKTQLTPTIDKKRSTAF